MGESRGDAAEEPADKLAAARDSWKTGWKNREDAAEDEAAMAAAACALGKSRGDAAEEETLVYKGLDNPAADEGIDTVDNKRKYKSFDERKTWDKKRQIKSRKGSRKTKPSPSRTTQRRNMEEMRVK